MKNLKKDLIGLKFGKLTVIEESGRTKKQCVIWNCKCECGNFKKIIGHNLTGKKTKSCGCNKRGPKRKLKYKIGDKINNITIIKIEWDKIHRNPIYYYVCECGGKGKKYPSNIKKKTCNCIEKRCYKSLTGLYWSGLKCGAKSRNLEFSIDIKETYELLEKQNFKCSLSGVDIKLGKNKDTKTASLDRIDSKNGYTKDNIQWVHKIVNKIKQNIPEKEFIEWCNLISKHKGYLNEK